MSRYSAAVRSLPFAVCLLILAEPLAAKDALGVFDDWAAFRDPSVPRCYAITAAEKNKSPAAYEAYADIGTWPRQDVR